MTTEIALRPSYWASVSGGKDSLYAYAAALEFFVDIGVVRHLVDGLGDTGREQAL